MPTSLVLTVIGADRPGLVELIAETAKAHQANWEASRMARLGNRFAGIVLVTVDDARVEELSAALRALAARGLNVMVETAAGSAADDGKLMRLDSVGPDRQGIVRELTAVLAARGVNVEELDTQVISAPMSGEPFFSMTATLRVPDAMGMSGLNEALATLSTDLVVDVSLVTEPEPEPERDALS